jgi:hypothetical protein
MDIDDLRKMRNRAPFRPFEIHLLNGQVLPVKHPESMSLPDDEKELFVIWTKNDWNLLDAAQVARIRVKRASAR